MTHRLKQARKALHFTQAEFAAHLGITQTAYSMIETGRRPLPARYIKTICAAFAISEEWLTTGCGEMFTAACDDRELAGLFRQLDPRARRFLLRMAQELLRTQQEAEPPQSTAATGPPDRRPPRRGW